MPVKVMNQSGFTLVELTLSMALFSFMLLIITLGFINIVQLHDAALASDQVQDNARSAMDELVQGVRNSAGIVTPTTIGLPSTTICVANNSGTQQIYYVNQKILYRTNDCATNINWTSVEPANTVALTNVGVQVSNFDATVETGGVGITEQEVQFNLTVASDNGTTNSTGTACANNNSQRAFCAVVSLTSGAVPR